MTSPAYQPERSPKRGARTGLSLELLLGFLAIVAVLIVTYLVGAASLRNVRDAAGDVAHSHAVKAGLEELLATLVDAETGQRGFLITGVAAYREPYESALAEYPTRVAALRSALADDAAQLADLDRLRVVTEAKLAELAETVRVREQDGPAAAGAIVASNRGKDLMDQMRAIAARMTEREDKRLARRIDRAGESYRSARSTAGVSTAMAFLALIALFVGTRRQAEERRQAAALAERLDVTLASIGDAVIATDASGRVARLNAVAESLTGWKESDAIGRPLTEAFVIINEATRLPAPNPVERVLREGNIVGLANHTLLIAKDGREIAIDDSAAPIKAAGGEITGVVMVFRDVTERRGAERELETAQSALLETDRRKDEFLAMLSHELRNPLGAITNAAELLKRLAPAEGKEAWAREVIDRQTRHLARLVDDLLDVSRVSRGRIVLRREPIPLAAAITLALETARPLLEARRHRFTTDLGPEPIWVDGDATRLAQVVANLLSNAARYTPEGGAVSLTLRREDGDAVIRVRDDGIGIVAELLPRVFDLFVRDDRGAEGSSSGLGLGLTLVKRLTEMHGGRVEAASGGPGAGSEFVVRLPAVAAPAVLPGRAAAPAAERRARRILVVDDNVDSGEALAVTLRMAGHEVVLTTDGPAALAAAEKARPDVALLDIGMPGMDGYEVARRLLGAGDARPLTLIAITGYGQEADREKARAAGFAHHITKPTSPETILALLDQPLT